MFKIWVEFLQAKKDSETLEFINGEFPFLLGESPGRKGYWLALPLKILQ
jgi:hypothetical protein